MAARPRCAQIESHSSAGAVQSGDYACSPCRFGSAGVAAALCAEPGSPARRRHRRATPAVPRPDDHSRPAGPHDAALSGMDSGRAHGQRPIVNLVGLKIQAGGQTVAWRRDSVNMYAFHIDVPAGASSVDAAFDFISPRRKAATRREARPRASWRWSTGTNLCCIPRARRPTVCNTRPLCACPAHGGTEPRCPSRAIRSEIEFQPAPLTTLIDSPLLAGAHFVPSSWAPIAARRTTFTWPATATAQST